MVSKLLRLIQKQFNVQLVETQSPLVTPESSPIPLFRQSMIQWGLERVTPNSNERTRCEGIVGQVMIGVAIHTGVSLFPGYPFEVDGV